MKTLKFMLLCLLLSTVAFSQSEKDTSKAKDDPIKTKKNHRICWVQSTSSNYSPLFVLNGVIVDENSEEIQDVKSDSSKYHIEVLKGASASAIYGARGANGVIVITDQKYRQKQFKKTKRKVKKKSRKKKPKKFGYKVVEAL